MITDQRQTGVPNRNAFTGSGTRGRTQFVKPNQVTNIGRSLPQNQNLAAALGSNARATPTSTPTAQTTTPTYNPVFPQSQGTQSPVQTVSTQVQTPVQTTTTRPQTQSMSEYLKAQAQNPSGAQLATSATNEAEQLIQDKDVARQAIRKMKSTDIIELLDELANGTLTGAD